jgi:ADP-heptose:LPS heptosyltransferase
MVILRGDDRAKPMEFDHPQIIRGAGTFTLREVMALVEVVDCVVGPESAIINFASAFPTPKLTLLSHSTHNNLCKHWENDYCIAPAREFAPCYPCHQLHYNQSSCPLAAIEAEDGEVLAQGPVCSMGAITIPALTSRLDEIYGKWLLNKG